MIAQTISNNANGETVLTASIGYDPMGRRTSRTVNAVDEGSGSSTTSYWYGKALVPLVVVRDGMTYRMIGGLVIEERVNGEAATQYYPHRDYTSSVRVVTDGTGAIAASLGYNGDWGSARIAGQEHVSSDAGMEAFYRFQSQEAEIFPLAALSITDTALETWLDELQLHHFPYREYSAGLAVFMSQDPASKASLPMRRWAPIRRMSVIRRGRLARPSDCHLSETFCSVLHGRIHYTDDVASPPLLCRWR